MADNKKKDDKFNWGSGQVKFIPPAEAEVKRAAEKDKPTK